MLLYCCDVFTLTSTRFCRIDISAIVGGLVSGLSLSQTVEMQALVMVLKLRSLMPY